MVPTLLHAHSLSGASDISLRVLIRKKRVTTIETLLDRAAALTPVDGFEYPPLPAHITRR